MDTTTTLATAIGMVLHHELQATTTGTTEAMEMKGTTSQHRDTTSSVLALASDRLFLCAPRDSYPIKTTTAK